MTPKGGKREGSGRPRRKEPKSTPVWCGQIPQWARSFILENLTPVERFRALMKAAREKAGGGK